MTARKDLCRARPSMTPVPGAKDQPTGRTMDTLLWRINPLLRSNYFPVRSNSFPVLSRREFSRKLLNSPMFSRRFSRRSGDFREVTLLLPCYVPTGPSRQGRHSEGNEANPPSRRAAAGLLRRKGFSQ
jgi:hypothetical protein